MDPNNKSDRTMTIAYLNVHGQTGLNLSKEKLIKLLLVKHDMDILNCHETNITEESFKQSLIASKYNIIKNNAIHKYGSDSET